MCIPPDSMLLQNYFKKLIYAKILNYKMYKVRDYLLTKLKLKYCKK